MGGEYTEHIGINEKGHLCVEEMDLLDLAQRFGTPLYVVSESQLRTNFRKYTPAFSSRYPRVKVYYAFKSNNNMAVRRVLTQEGAGGDCFGIGELYLSLLAGTDPKMLVMNGSNKTPEEIEAAIQAGVPINVDCVQELDLVNDMARRLGKVHEINVRIKPFLSELEDKISDWSLLPIANAVWLEYKWGLDRDTAVEACRRALSMENVKLTGIHFHMGRVSNEPAVFGAMARAVTGFIAELKQRLDWEPSVLDLGGGYAFGRPEGHGPRGVDKDVAPIDAFAEQVTGALREGFARHDIKEPALILETGRFIAGNSTVLLTRVGVVKDLPGIKRWVNVDTSTNHLPRITSSGWYHHMVVANKAAREPDEVVDIVGPLCNEDILGAERRLPRIESGDLIAILDAGAYGESNAMQYNLQPRPATVLVKGDQADVIRRRETLQDVIALQSMPPRLLG